jgi:hypothetical protein
MHHFNMCCICPRVFDCSVVQRRSCVHLSPFILQLKAKSGHGGEGLLLHSPPVSDSPSMQAQRSIMAPVALRAAYPGSELMDASMGHMHVAHGMIPTLDEQPLDTEDLEDGIVLAQSCPIDFQVHQSRNIMHPHSGHDSMQAQYAMQGMMGMMAPPSVVMSYTAPLRPRGMPMPHGMLPHSLHHTVPMHSQFMGGNSMSSMGSAVPHDIQTASLLVDESMRAQNGFLGMNDDLVRSHSPGLVNGINSFFADDPQ